MLTKTPIAIAMIGWALCLSGCADEDVDTAVRGEGGTGVGLTPTAYEANNGLLPSCFWSVGAQKTLRALGQGALADANGTMPPMPSLSAACQDTIKYAVECALDDTQSVNNPFDPVHPFEGLVGLAKDWRTQALDSDGRRWVTACMVERLNAFGVKVPILLEGDKGPLYESTEGSADFPYKESTAFGDLFSSTAPLTGLTPAFTAYVCSESDLLGTCINASSLLNIRFCDNVGLLCGVQHIGKCSTKCEPNGPYWTCPNYGYSQTIRVRTQDNLCL